MDFREKLNQYPYAGFAIAAAVLITAVAYCWHSVASGNHIAGLSDHAYYTTDDTLTGQSAVDALFSAPVSNVPPFDHGGKPAYRAVAYSCNGGKSVWVQYLFRYSPKVYDAVVAAYAQEGDKGNRYDPNLEPFESGMEVKSPGPGPWVGAHDRSFARIEQLTAPADVRTDDLNLFVP